MSHQSEEDTPQRSPHPSRSPPNEFSLTWFNFTEHISPTTKLSDTEADTLSDFITTHISNLFAEIPAWYRVILRSHAGAKILDLSDAWGICFKKYSFCCDFIVALREALFSEDGELFQHLFGVLHDEEVELLRIGDTSRLLQLFKVISHQIHPATNTPHSNVPSDDFTRSLLTFDFEHSFAPEFSWFRHLISNYIPCKEQYFSTDLSIATAQPFFPTTKITTPLTFESLTRNRLMNSYAELEYYQSLPPTSTSEKPPHIQFPNFSSNPHPIFTVSPTAMSDLSFVQSTQFQVYFIWMYVICEPQTFSTFIDSYNSIITSKPHIKTCSNLSSHLRLIYQAFSKQGQSHSCGLFYQLQIFNYRIYLLSSSTDHLRNSTSITRITPFCSSDNVTEPFFRPIDLLDPILFTFPANPTHALSHVLENWKLRTFRITAQEAELLEEQFLPWLFNNTPDSPSSDTFVNAWYLRCVYSYANCSPSFAQGRVGHYCDAQRPFVRLLIERSYDQLIRNTTTVYQHLHSRSLELQHKHDASDLNQFFLSPITQVLSFLLLSPFHLFDDDTNDHIILIQKHITLSIHSGFLNSQLSHTNPIKPNPFLHRALLPFSATVYTWLLVKSGLTAFFQSPIGEGASNCFFHSNDRRYRDNDRCEYANTCIEDVSISKFGRFATPNNINLIPNPLFDKTDPIVNQIESLVVDTDGEIWFVRLNDELSTFDVKRSDDSATNLTRKKINQSNSDSQKSPTTLVDTLPPSTTSTTSTTSSTTTTIIQQHRAPNWDSDPGVTTFQFNDPFSHTVPWDLFAQSREGKTIEDYDFDFYATWAASFVANRINMTPSFRHGRISFSDDWAEEESAMFRSWIWRNKQGLFDQLIYRGFGLMEQDSLQAIHPGLNLWLMFIQLGLPVDFNRQFHHQSHRFDNPNNQAECALINSETNQSVLKTPQIKALKQRYKHYRCNDLYQKESQLVADVMKTVLLNANNAGLLDADEEDNAIVPHTLQKCYPFPHPTPLPQSLLPSNYHLSSSSIPTQPDELRYHRDLSMWCIEMVLISALHLQPSIYLKDLDYQLTYSRPDRVILDPLTQSQKDLSELISRATTALTGKHHHQHFISSAHIEPIHPIWLLLLNASTDPWFMFDDLLLRITTTTLKSYEALFSLSE